MNTNKVWFITGAGRGMGLDIAKAALAAGHFVVASGRDPTKLAQALGDNNNLLIVKLDVTKPDDARSAVQASIAHFGKIDVLVNNAANFYAGFFEEFTPEQIERQMSTNLFGPMNVTRAVLPEMRKAHTGHIITISSTAGFVGYEHCSAYAASKFALEGWMESLHLEIMPFNIKTTIVEPGFFRTELLEPTSTTWAELHISDYDERNAQLVPAWKEMNGKQSGDPKKLANALINIADLDVPPFRWLAGADAISEAERKLADFKKQGDAYKDLSLSLGHDN